MVRDHIEQEAKRLHSEIWNNKHLLWPEQQLSPIQMLRPEAAAQVLGVVYQEYTSLGGARFSYRGEKFITAGLIDRQSSRIAVSTEFSREVVRFTAGHEIGHWTLHPNEIMHRDRPIGSSIWGASAKRPAMEREADYFSACFYMPARLLSERFSAQFGITLPFVFDEATCFHLGLTDLDSFLYPEEDSLDREYALARCVSYRGRQLNSLSKQFGMSDSAMAIRIKELKLVRWP